MLPGVGRRTVEHFGREMRAAHDLAERGIFEIGQARAVTGLRQEQVPETFGARQRLQLLDNRIDLPRPEFFRLAIEALLVRIDVPVHETFELALELDDFRRHRVEHLSSP
ncbi:hypothetical protein ACVW1A_005923 [Bradyrhizobium sp. LB1.3]